MSPRCQIKQIFFSLPNDIIFLCNLLFEKCKISNVGYFGHGRFGHGHFGQDISAMINAKGGRFGHDINLCVFLY